MMHCSTVCSVCGSKPAWMNFGSITCASCKMFFRRNEYYDLNKNKCRFNTICNINRNTRRLCSYCRLKKCFFVGMKRELFRSAHSTNTSYSQQKKEVIYPLDLLQIDRSTLTTNQWALLSNIINIYDAKCPIEDIRKSLTIQSACPAKMRMKLVSANYMNLINSLYMTLVQSLESVFHLNILSKNDRSILMERTILSLGGVNILFIIRELNLHKNYEYLSCAITTYGLSVTQKVAQIATRMDNDGTLFKLLLITLSFSTCYDSIYPKDDYNISLESILLSNPIRIYSIQNIYIEVMFKYMLFRYGYEQASLRFANLIKIILDQNMCLETIRDIRFYKYIPNIDHQIIIE